jgi:hypothetical protein
VKGSRGAESRRQKAQGRRQQGIADFRLEIADLKEHGRQKVEPEAKSRHRRDRRQGAREQRGLKT